MNRRQKIIVSITGIFIVLLALVGLTYAYFLTRITGNNNDKSISVTTANLELVYGDGNGSLDAYGTITPGTKIKFLNTKGTETTSDDEVVDKKTFTVTNNGNGTVDSYAVILEDLIISYASAVKIGETTYPEGTATYLESPNDMKLKVTCTSTKEGKTCGGMDGTFPTTNDILFTNSIDVGETHEYTLTMEYIESGQNQSADMNKSLTAKVNIIDTKDTVDIAGTVTNYGIGDYVEVHSTPRKATIDKDGNYKVVGLEPDLHEVKVVSDVVTTVEKIKIEKGKTASIGTTTVEEETVKLATITNESRTITMDIDANTNSGTINNEIKEYNPFKEGTLAYNIYKNAKENKNGTQYLETPKNKVAEEPSYNLKIDNEKVHEFPEDMLYYTDEKNDTINGTPVTKCSENLVGGYLYTKEDYLTEGYYKDIAKIHGCDGDDFIIIPDGNYTLEEPSYNWCIGDTATSDLYGWTDDEEMYCYNPATKCTQDIVDKYLYEEMYELWPGSGEMEPTLIVGCDGDIPIIEREQLTVSSPYSSMSFQEDITLSKTVDDYGTSFYFRGNVKDNYVNFAGMCWRAVRIDGKANIKLILEDQDQLCNSKDNLNNLNMDGNWDIEASDGTTITMNGSTPYRTGNFGFEYIDGGFYKMSYLNPIEDKNRAMSNAFKYFQTKTLNSKITSFHNDKKISDYLVSGNWCLNTKSYSDRKGNTLLENPTYTYNLSLYFDSYVRLAQKNPKEPTLKCPVDTLEKFGDNTTSMYVGTLTGDEIVYAGGKWFESNINYYLINSWQKNNLKPFYTLSPAYYGSPDDMIMFVNFIEELDFYGNLDANPVENDVAFRPSVILKSNVTIESGGEGTIDNPYIIG